jgi:hypothetical protein
MRRARWLVIVPALILALPRAARAQSAAMVEAARAQIEALNPDSAYALLQRALAQGDPATPRARAFTLLGITELLRGNRTSAQFAFRQALRIEPSLRIDSLADLHSEALAVFGEQRAAVAPDTRPFAVAVEVPPDTVVGPGEYLRIDVRPTARARVIVQVVREGESSPLWADSQTVDVLARALWDLTGPDSATVPLGRYVVRVLASASGQMLPPVERVLELSRLPIDTTPWPASLDSSALEPETLRLRHAAPSRLALAGALGLAALALPSLLGSGEVNGTSGRATLVAGAVSIAGLVGFLSGHHPLPLPDAIARNQQLRERRERQRAIVAAGNAALIGRAPMRVRSQAGP